MQLQEQELGTKAGRGERWGGGAGDGETERETGRRRKRRGDGGKDGKTEENTGRRSKDGERDCGYGGNERWGLGGGNGVIEQAMQKKTDTVEGTGGSTYSEYGCGSPRRPHYPRSQHVRRADGQVTNDVSPCRNLSRDGGKQKTQGSLPGMAAKAEIDRRLPEERGRKSCS